MMANKQDMTEHQHSVSVEEATHYLTYSTEHGEIASWKAVANNNVGGNSILCRFPGDSQRYERSNLTQF